MADVLSQTEVESLLAALDTGGKSTPTDFHDTRLTDEISSPVSVYDFKRPERVSKEQMRAFEAMHEGFSREFGAGLSGMLRSIVEVKLVSVDQLTYSEFVYSLGTPTCFNLLESHGLDGHLILDLNPSILFPVVDRLLGGGKHTNTDLPNRAMTEIELRLVSRITSLAITALKNAWSNLCDLELRVVQVESNPQLVQIVPPNEVVVLIVFEITMGEVRGFMNLCIPYNTIEPVTSQVSSDAWSAYTKRAVDERQVVNLETGISQASVEMVVNMAQTVLRACDVVNLTVGDVIQTEVDKDQGIQVCIEGRPMFAAKPGVLKGHKAIQIEKTITQPHDVIEAKLKSLESDNPQE